jgi:hypothetical protein
VVILDEDLLLMSSAASRTAAWFEDRGYRLELVDFSEYEKLERCVTCLSVRVRCSDGARAANPRRRSPSSASTDFPPESGR